MNSSVVVGEWWYFIRPTAFVSSAPAAEFWRVRLIPYWYANNNITQYERLADLPGLYVNAGTSLQSDIQLLVYDEPSKKIISIFETVQVYDIDTNTWSAQTPPGWRRHIGCVGGWKPSNTDPSLREIWFKGIVRDASDGAGKWSNLVLSGAVKRLKYTETQLDRAYPDSPSAGGNLRPAGANVLAGKHRRHITPRIWKDTTGTTIAPQGAAGGYVWIFGGDFSGVPFTSFPTTYPNHSRWIDDSARTDHWRVGTKEDPVTGRLIVEMASNGWYQYGNASATVKPPSGDAVGIVCDKRGDFWFGPGYNRFSDSLTQPDQPMAVMRFRLPLKHTDGIRKGDGWTLPPQNYLIANNSTYDAVTNPGGRQNADDLFIGNDPGSALFGSSHVYTTYDPKTDAIVFMSCGDRFNGAFYSFPCVPTAGRQVWTRQTVSLSSAERSRLYAFLNSQTRPGATPFAESGPGTIVPSPFKVGAQHVINDHLYVLCVTNSGGGYNHNAVVWITKWNLRNLSEPPEYIALPSFFCRGIDQVLGPADTVSDSLCQSPPEFRDLLLMGHILAFGPPSDNVVDTDPLFYWYDTYRRKWTIGPSFAQIKAEIPAIPDQPGRFGGFPTQRFAGAKGRAWAVPETGEIWFACSDWGIIRYRII